MKTDEILIPCPLPERRIYEDEMFISYCIGHCKHYTTCDSVQKAEMEMAINK